MAAFTYSYEVVSRGQDTVRDTTYDAPQSTPREFAKAYGARLDVTRPPMPHPVTVRVWAGADIDRDPDYVLEHTLRRNRGRALSAVAS
ncbi:hypothetical protein [Actinoplanes rectilineatus]|uniref:hypothetical protein n=1 Tax=Actinoplanes rectilineatus TaxID=113571 RepID=UPI0005F2E2F0|nr:hypothetical protein [Actinoplanes rectilineatus]